MRYEWKDDVDGRRYVIEPANIDPKHLWMTALTGNGPFTEQPVRREILHLAEEIRSLRADKAHMLDIIAGGNKSLHETIAIQDDAIAALEAEIATRRRQQDEAALTLRQVLEENGRLREERSRHLAALDGMAKILRSLDPVG